MTAVALQVLPLVLTLAGVALWALHRPAHKRILERLRLQAKPGAGLWDSLRPDEKPAMLWTQVGRGLILAGVALTTWILFF